jgi:GH15 family glucan-1,4-alpha-glucosidase
MEAIGKELTTPFGGIARYSGDQYYRDEGVGEDIPGNPWPVCTLWQAQWEIARAKTPEDLKRAEPYLRWIQERAEKGTGVLAEQYNPLTGEPRSTMPLTWSHAELVATCRTLSLAEKQLSQRTANEAQARPRSAAVGLTS